MSVTLLSRLGNQFKVTFDDGSVALAVQASSTLFVINNNVDNAQTLTQLGNGILITFNDGSTQIALPTGSDLFVTGAQSVITPPPPPKPTWGEPMSMTGVVITSPFGWRKNPVGSGNEFHEGVDLSAGGILGRKVVSVGPGAVSLTTFISYVGNYVEIHHTDNSVTGYAHMEDSASHYVKVGTKVVAGTQIGRVGSSGESTGAHLELRTRNSPSAEMINPVVFMKARGVDIP